MPNDLKAVIAKLNKKYGDNTINFVKDMGGLKIDRISTGSLTLDYVLGKNQDGDYGLPMGRMIELYGHFSSGKSLISLMTIAEAQKKGLDCIYIDAENGFDPAFADIIGVDVDKLILSQVSVGEEVMDILSDILESQKKVVVVVDSIASLAPIKEMEESMEQHNIALTARLMSKALRKLTALNKHALIIFINQIRISPTAYGNPETTSGGKALGHYASVRVEIRKGEPLMEKKNRIGQVVKFKVTKNKTSAPYKDGYFKFFYDGRIDRIDELVTLGLLQDKIERTGAYYTLAGEKHQGREAMEMALESDKDYYEKAKKEIME